MKWSRHSKLVIGWDVRGWMSKEQAVAILSLSDDEIEWLGFSERFQLSRSENLALSSLLSPAINGDLGPRVVGHSDITVAIDAPLAFSSPFRALVGGAQSVCAPPNSEIENALAYRACERWVHEQFNKKPLSASFDKLGNNASLAISLAITLRKQGFRVVPQDGLSSSKAIIEVYPGLAKTGLKRSGHAIPPLAQLIPSNLRPGTDIYDAAICALLGAIYAGWGRKLDIPPLVSPADGLDKSEGWIFCLPPDYVRSFQLAGVV